MSYRDLFRTGWGVYLSGPMEGCTEAEANDWRRYCRDRLAPHMAVRIPELAPNYDDYLAMVRKDREDIAASHYVLVNPWKNSTGTSMEAMLAWQTHKHVVVVERPGGYVNPWMRYHSDYIAPTVAAACDAIIYHHLHR
jgi:hypothetical protein